MLNNKSILENAQKGAQNNEGQAIDELLLFLEGALFL
jgi:hypothetical protein